MVILPKNRQSDSATDADYDALRGEEFPVDYNFSLMRTRLVQQGLPVIPGEYSVTGTSSLTGEQMEQHLVSRDCYFYYLTKLTKGSGIIPIVRDNRYPGNNGCARFNRQNNMVTGQQALNGSPDGVAEKKYIKKIS
jgi:endoglucanase